MIILKGSTHGVYTKMQFTIFKMNLDICYVNGIQIHHEFCKFCNPNHISISNGCLDMINPGQQYVKSLVFL